MVSAAGGHHVIKTTYLSRGRMQHADVLSGHDMDQFTRLNVSDLNEVWFESKNVRIREGKRVRVAFP